MITISIERIKKHLSTMNPEILDEIDDLVTRSFTDGEADIESYKRQCRAFQMLFTDKFPQIGIKHGQVLELVARALGYKNWNTLSGMEKK